MHLYKDLMALWTTSCRLLQPTGPGYGCLGIGKGNFEGWKPPKAGGCGWVRCPQNCVLSHIAQDMVCFWFGVVGGQCAQILGLLETFLRAVRGHIVELEFSTGKSSCMCGVATISLHLAVLSRFQGGFRGKKGNCGPKLQILKCRSSTCDARSRQPQLKSLPILCVVYPSHPQVACTKFWQNLKHHNGAVIFPHFARTCCLLAACCLLLACLPNLLGPPSTLESVIKPRLVPPAR